MAFQYGLSLENFKIFSDKQEFEFAPITIFTGANGSGKSTINQAIKLLSNHFKDDLFTESGKGIIFENLLSNITPEQLGNSVGEFKNLVNKFSIDKEIIITIPSEIDFYSEEIEMSIIFNEGQHESIAGKFKELNIYEKHTKKMLFQLYLKDEKKYICKTNFKLFYERFEQDRKLLKSIFNLLIEKNRYEDKMNLQCPTDLINDINNYKNKIFGKLNVSLNYTNGDLHIEYPFEIQTIGIQDDFEKQKAFLQKKVRLLKQFVLENIQENLILNYKNIEGQESQDQLVGKLLDEAISLDTNNNSNVESANRILLSLLSDFENEVGYFNQKTNEIDEFFNPFNQRPFYIDQTSNILKILKANNIIDDSNESFNDFGLGDDKILSDFGSSFFYEYVNDLVVDSVRHLTKFKSIKYFNNLVNYSSSRSINNVFNNGNASGLYYYFLLNNPQKIEVTDFIKKWLIEYEIASDIDFVKHEQSVSIYITRNGIRYNIADDGFGVSRILPLLIEIGLLAIKSYDNMLRFNEASTFIIEEPETGLHPALQSKLADLFLDAYKRFNIQTIIETHSEYLIRRYQVLVAQDKMQQNDVQIYYLNNPEKLKPGEIQTYPINIKPDGSLTKNFGKGFFDESSNLNIALYMKSSIQQN
jgi:predicted ATPase